MGPFWYQLQRRDLNLQYTRWSCTKLSGVWLPAIGWNTMASSLSPWSLMVLFQAQTCKMAWTTGTVRAWTCKKWSVTSATFSLSKQVTSPARCKVRELQSASGWEEQLHTRTHTHVCTHMHTHTHRIAGCLLCR